MLCVEWITCTTTAQATLPGRPSQLEGKIIHLMCDLSQGTMLTQKYAISSWVCVTSVHTKWFRNKKWVDLVLSCVWTLAVRSLDTSTLSWLRLFSTFRNNIEVTELWNDTQGNMGIMQQTNLLNRGKCSYIWASSWSGYLSSNLIWILGCFQTLVNEHFRMLFLHN